MPIVDAAEPDIRQLVDPVNSTGTLRQLLTAKLNVTGDFVAVKTYLAAADVLVIPVSTPWTIRCNDGSGITVAFFTPEKESELLLQVASAQPNTAECMKISLRTAKVLTELLAGR